MMHKKSSFPQRGRPEVWHKRNILLRCSVEHLTLLPGTEKSFAGTFRYNFVEHSYFGLTQDKQYQNTTCLVCNPPRAGSQHYTPIH